ncbi:sensor histidine kinase [Taibaiella koreensis]|uniref:sensor histidine kinase n=1 Tax=Taibaiella koreensis TaxID=1268548 RepID=UPI0019698CEF|nr:sensor histidine kinase [Taibaiella koreensis]
MCYLICKKTALLFITLLIALNVTGITSDYSVTHYTNENGLPQNSIKGIELDKNGFLWLATESGLLRFDGRQFKLYDRKHFPVMVSNRIIGFMGLTEDNMVYFYDEHLNYYSFNQQQELTRIDAKAIRRTPDGYDPRQLDLDKINGKDEGFLGIRDTVFYISGNKNLWIRRLPDVNQEVYTVVGHLNEKLYYLNKQLKIKSIDKKGNIKDVLLKGVHPDLMVTGPYNYCFFQQARDLYLLIGKGIYQLQETGEQELTADLMLQTDVPGIYAYRNYPSLNLQAIGSLTHGLYLYRKKQFKTLRYPNGYGNFYSQAVYRDTGVLTNWGLIYPSSSRFGYPLGIRDMGRSLLRDARGHYWINSWLLRDGKFYNVIELDEQLKMVKRYSGKSALCYQQTPDGTIWVLTHDGYQYRMGRISGDSVKLIPGLRSKTPVITFLPENNEAFWIGGVNSFVKLNVRTGKEQHYKSLEQFTIETLYLDADKVLWIGTTGNGFFALKENKVYQLPLDSKNNLSNVHAFIEDKSGFLWMSTNNGLFRCRKEELTPFIDHRTATVYYQYFSKESGFNTNEFNGSCTPFAVVLGNGKFSFPSLDGLVQFYPDSINEVLPVSKIFVDKLLIDGKPQLLTGNRISIDPSFKYLEVQVASPYFGHPANQMLEYRLTGLDSAWQPLKEDNTVVFNNLAYGKYNLQFRKRAGFGNSNFVTTSVLLSVKPFFYQTIYFKAALLIAMSLLVFLIVKLRYAYLVKRNKALEQEVEQRTLHLRSANHLKEKILMMVGHDLQSPLHFLGYLSESNYDALMSKEHEKAGLISREMKNTTKKIYAFVDEFNLWARAHDERFNLKKMVFSLDTLLNELHVFYKEILEIRGNRLTFTMSRAYELYTNRELLKAVLRNLVDNANKHTRDGVIDIYCTEYEHETCLIRVSDTGNGMSPEVLSKLRTLISERDKTFAIEPGSKLGYQFIIDFAVRLGASIAIDSEKNKGTNVSIYGIRSGVSTFGTLHHH